MIEVRGVEHGVDARLDSPRCGCALLVGQHCQHGAGQRAQLDHRIVAERVGLEQYEQFVLVVELHQAQEQGCNQQAASVRGQDVAADAQFQASCIITRQRER